MLLVIPLLSGCFDTGEKNTSFTSAGPGTDGASSANSAPTISGSPHSAVFAGDEYSYTPSASDADGDALTFSVSNLPRWASFSTTTGRLYGQALLGDIGVYDAIQISVSDGTNTTALPDFSITVTEVALGSMSLSWTAPTENTDGTALTDLGGFKLYFGTSVGNYPNSVRIDNPSINTYLVENLLPDTYYIVATSFNTAGIESSYSNFAVKTVASN